MPSIDNAALVVTVIPAESVIKMAVSLFEIVAIDIPGRVRPVQDEAQSIGVGVGDGVGVGVGAGVGDGVGVGVIGVGVGVGVIGGNKVSLDAISDSRTAAMIQPPDLVI